MAQPRLTVIVSGAGAEISLSSPNAATEVVKRTGSEQRTGPRPPIETMADVTKKADEKRKEIAEKLKEMGILDEDGKLIKGKKIPPALGGAK